MRIPPELLDSGPNDAEIETNLGATLDLLSRHECRATFFFLGRLGQTAPRLVSKVAEAGHEIACHSLFHLRLTGLSRPEFREAASTAKSRLEDACGQNVVGFRAPDFSVGSENPWVFDELAEVGFRYDSSVVPTRIHDNYGMQGTPHTIFRWPNGLIEFPLPVVKVVGVNVPIGGGGYFRLYPIWWTRRTFLKRQKQGRPTVFYIHPYEIGAAAPRISGLPPWCRFRHYVRLSDGVQRLGRLLPSLRCLPMAEVLAEAGYDLKG